MKREFLSFVVLIVTLLPYVLGGDQVDPCLTASSCGECTGNKYTGCIWCKLKAPTNSTKSQCVSGNYRGSSASGICSDYYWGQCTINGNALDTEFSYLIFILLFILIVLLLITIGICLCCKKCGKRKEEKKKQSKRKALDFSESYMGTSMRDITKSAASSLRRKNKQQEEDDEPVITIDMHENEQYVPPPQEPVLKRQDSDKGIRHLPETKSTHSLASEVPSDEENQPATPPPEYIKNYVESPIIVREEPPVAPPPPPPEPSRQDSHTSIATAPTPHIPKKAYVPPPPESPEPSPRKEEPSSPAPPPPPMPDPEKPRTSSINLRTIGSTTGSSNPSNLPPSPGEENILWDIEKELEEMKKGLEM